jgi:indole-3-glycerol phosphate synthase
MLKTLVEDARETIQSGYYRRTEDLRAAPSLRRAIESSPHRPAIIAEIKPASPTKGKMVPGGFETLMKRFLAEGACGLSVLTEPKHFHGSLANLRLAVATKAPTLMKDFILDEIQIDCAATIGASAVLLIASILPKSRVQPLIEYAHVAEREVLLECADRAELEMALGTEADMIGLNNRDLRSFRVDLTRTPEMARGLEFDRPFVSLSGFESRADVQRVEGVADACLVGSSLMEGRVTVAELVKR